MKSRKQKISAIFVIAVFVAFVLGFFVLRPGFEKIVTAQDGSPDPIPTQTPKFDQEGALAKLRDEIKGREKEPAEKVFKNIKSFQGVPAGRLLAIMKFGYARSLGVDCTHCHVPDKWESESKPQKQIARDMKEMAAGINESLKNMESLGGRQSFVNCTTCHRGQIKPALNLSAPKPQPKPEPKRKPEVKTKS